jgi:uridine kinase
LSEKQQDNLTENKILNFAQKEKFDLEIFGQQIQDIEKKALDGETDLLKAYVLLKRIEA